VLPELIFMNGYATHPALIKAYCAVASPFVLKDYDHVLFSFHGLPQRQILKSDPHGSCLRTPQCCSPAQFAMYNPSCYSAQCYATARLIAERLQLSPDRFSLAFQSRLGKDPWLQPYASEQLEKLATQGVRRLLVFSPSFVCDCLETIFEIGVEYAHLFKKAGGEQLQLVPGLNDHPAWLEALQTIIEERL